MPRYPFDPETLDAIPEELTKLYRGLEIDLLEKICSQLRVSDSLNESALQAIRALRAQGVNLYEIRKSIQRTTKLSDERLDAILKDVEARNEKYYGEMVDFAKLTRPARFIDVEDVYAIQEQTHGEMQNITQSMAFMVYDNGRFRKLPIADAYQWALDKAVVKVQSGAYSYNEAIAGAVKQLADGGLKTVQYDSGHVDQIDVAVRRAVLSGVNSLNQRYRENSMNFLETDLVEITAHLGARNIPGPLGFEAHSEWQGKVYAWKKRY